MQDFKPVEDWLNSLNFNHANKEQQRFAYRQTINAFANFSQKTVLQILEEYSKSTKNEFKKNYTELLLSYTARLQKSLPPNSVREQVDIIRTFFEFHKLPLGFGLRAHIQFFFK